MTSSGGEPKIYLRGVTPHILIHGGLGHRPPPFEELILFDLIWVFLDLFCVLWRAPSLAFIFDSCKLGLSLFPQLLSLS